MGLGARYSVGGGTDESTQTLTYTVTAVPDAAVGTIYLADGQTTVAAQQNLSITELQGLRFLAAPNAAGQATFSFSVTDSGNGDNTITETVNLDILGFNDTPVLPTTAITITDAQEDQAYTFSANDLLAGVTDPDIQYDANGVIASRPYGDTLSVVNLSVSNGELATTPPLISTPSPQMPTSTASLASTTSSMTVKVAPSPTPSISTSSPLTTLPSLPSRLIKSQQKAIAPSVVC